MNSTSTFVLHSSTDMDEMESSEMNGTILWELNEKERIFYRGTLIFLVLVMLIGIVGNILVLIIYRSKFKRTSARVYILCLAMADLSVCVIGLPYHILDLTFILTYNYTHACKVISFLIGACTLSSVFILLVVGLDRYLKVCRPLKRQIIDFGDRKACLIAVFIATIVSIPNGVLYGQSTVKTSVENITGVECFIDDEFQDSDLPVGYFAFNFLVFVLSVLYLVIIYGFICRKIYRHDRMSGEIALKTGRRICCCAVPDKDDDEGNGVDEDGEMSNKDMELVRMNAGEDNDCDTEDNSEDKPSESKSNARATASIVKPVKKKPGISGNTMIRHRVPGAKMKEKNTRKITLMMLTITVVFVIAYLPFIVISILDSLDPTLWSDSLRINSFVYDFLLRIYLINNAANPIIYSFWDSRFRRETVNLIKKILCIGTSVESTTVTKTMITTANTSPHCCTEVTLR